MDQGTLPFSIFQRPDIKERCVVSFLKPKHLEFQPRFAVDFRSLVQARSKLKTFASFDTSV